ncbi:hypothetical protein H4219_000540 [Mycoemilia scoparia]|uniref:Glucosidase 2 subunit beta n=1 Tax=Mycoemilia scoparia TaxID=417184 RepID=A0A9W8DWF2_9FUNG|nr:hypothetical protein H4219_000540 [Mycoemilia scoparia]
MTIFVNSKLTLTLTLIALSGLNTSLYCLAQQDLGVNAKQLSYVRGVSPELLRKYQPNENQTFSCLDGSKVIKYERVNDDYCDCPDGSDEPGTSACNNSKFYCENKGHIPSIIDSIRVNDGICDEACCDGSDEWGTSTECPNTCEAVNREYRKVVEERQRIELAGAKLKQEYIETARKLLQENTEKLSAKEKELAKKTKEFEELEKKKDDLENKERELREKKNAEKESKLNQVKSKVLSDVFKLRTRLSQNENDSKQYLYKLVNLVHQVKVGHNAEYDDKAVTMAIEAYDQLSQNRYNLENDALRAFSEEELAEQNGNEENDLKRDEESYDSCTSTILLLDNNIKQNSEDISELEKILNELKQGYNKNYHDSAVKGAVQEYETLLQERASREPTEEQKKARDEQSAQWRETLESAKKDIEEIETEFSENSANNDSDSELDGMELSSVRDDYYKSRGEKSTIENEIEKLKKDIDANTGPDHMLLALKGQCMSKDLGQYTYEICWLENAVQIENRDNSRQNLGSFAGLGAATTSSDGDDTTRIEDGGDDLAPAHFVHRYENGAYCWNGPHRSIMMVLECGEINEIMSVIEPTKCEYQAKVKSPVACPNLETLENQKHSSHHDGEQPKGTTAVSVGVESEKESDVIVGSDQKKQEEHQGSEPPSEINEEKPVHDEL